MMLARLYDLLGRASAGGSAIRSSREWFARRGFRCFTFAARVVDALDRTLAVHHSALRLPALELSIEHSAGEDGCRPVAPESERQHPSKNRQNQSASQAHRHSPFDEADRIMA
jgi:hypothetical protein